MKIGWFLFAISGQSVNSQDQLHDDLTKIARARDEMARAIGSIDTFIYGSLREKPAIGARSGKPSKPEEIKDKLNARLIEIQERFQKVLDKCGPGANKDITKDESKPGLGVFQRTNDLFQPGFGPGSIGHPNYISDMPMSGWIPGSDDVNGFKKLGESGQTDADILGGIGFGGEHGMFGFGDRFNFGNGGAVGLGNFDPLNAMNFQTSTRRRKRFAEGQKVTKGLIRKKVREMNKSFAPMEKFISENLVDCTESRKARMVAKIEKTKARVEKVVNRQGQNLMRKKNK